MEVMLISTNKLCIADLDWCLLGLNAPIVLRFINGNAFGNILATQLINQVSLNQK